MGRIGVEPSGDITPRESGLTSLGCWRTGTDSQPARGAKQNCLGQQCPWCGPRRTSVAGPAAVPSRLTPRPMGQPRPVRGVVGRRSRARSCLAGALFDADYREGKLTHSSRLSIAVSPPSSSRSCYPVLGGRGGVILLDDRTILSSFPCFQDPNPIRLGPGLPF
jgi:hypothetical protein